jgi:hypothetical protein
MSAYRLKIGRTLDVPVKFALRDGGKDVAFTVTLVIKRPTLDEFTALIERVNTEAVTDRELLADCVIDWHQTLVLDDATDKPVAYSPEAMDLMCSVLGLRAELVRGVFDALTRSFSPAAQAEAKLGN